MSTIKFTTPLTKYESKNPWVFDKKYFDEIPPNTAGVYIVGVKILVNDFENPNRKIEKFCPLIVGEAINLRKRLNEHQIIDGSGYFNTKKELFDIYYRSPQDFYKDIQLFELSYKRSLKETIVAGHPDKSKEELKPHLFKVIKIGGNNSLIWFPCPSFFNSYFNLNESVLKKTGATHKDSIGINGDLQNAKFPKKEASILENKIIKVKKLISTNFYFAVATTENNPEIDFSDNKIRKGIEFHTKEKIKTISVHTYATANNVSSPYFIDLSAIQNELVNMTDASFPTKLIL
jgi:hypothetical protein